MRSAIRNENSLHVLRISLSDPNSLYSLSGRGNIVLYIENAGHLRRRVLHRGSTHSVENQDVQLILHIQ
jgi:hypothetical protein